MINRKTVVILGAGASTPYGFPGGEQLLFEISSDLIQPGSELRIVLGQIFPGISEKKLTSLGKSLRASHQPSVDAFLSSKAREEWRDVGKAAIAASLLKYENPSAIKRQPEDSSRGKWYTHLFQLFGSTEDDFLLSSENLSVITFNYDRTIEYALLQALHHSFSMKNDQVKQIIKDLPIVHVYGSLGELGELNQQLGVSFGASNNAQTLVVNTNHAFQNIQILPEDTSSNSSLSESRGLIESAKSIVFLGFGYLRQNLDRLFQGIPISNKTFYGTFFQAGNSLRDQTILYLVKLGVPKGLIHFGNTEQDCLKFLREYNAIQ